MRLALISFISLLCLSGVTFATEEKTCFESVVVDQPMSCSGVNGAGSADFTGGCSSGPQTVQVPVECPPSGRWVNIPQNTYTTVPTAASLPTHAEICAYYGMKVANQGGKTCASGERRPTVGDGWDAISYKYGTKGGGNGGDGGDRLMNVPVRTTVRSANDQFSTSKTTGYRQMCYDNSMGKRNNTKQDASVAVFCEDAQ